MDDLTCQELVELVTEYLDDVLTPAERVRFEGHLADCDECPRYVEQLRVTVRVIGQLSERDLAEPVRASLLAAFRTWKQR
jgi:anti-sigma factor RsiW